MIKLYKDREIVDGEKHNIYRNLNNGLFSVKNKRGLVVAHVDNVITYNNTFTVKEKARQKVLKERVRNVHAWVNFDKIETIVEEIDTEQLDELYYSPYKLDCFINKRTREKMEFVNKLYFANGKAYILE